jgi:hypothetical protein
MSSNPWLEPLVDNIPDDLRERVRWGNWTDKHPYAAAETKSGKFPVSTASLHLIGVNRPGEWTTFDSALEAYRRRADMVRGLAYLLHADDGFVGIDIDNCLNQEGSVKPWAQPILEKFETYWERSPSGTGIKGIIRAQLAPKVPSVNHIGDGTVELYATNRFFAITGHIIGGASREIGECQSELDWLLQYLGVFRPKAESQGSYESRKWPLADLEAIIEGCAWMRHCRDDAEILPEQEWYGELSVVGRCKDGTQLAHDLSRPHPNYTHRETTKKLHQARTAAGPVRCETVANKLGQGQFCNSCKHWGRISSPINLGTPVSEPYQRFESEDHVDDWPEPLPFVADGIQQLRDDVLLGSLGEYARALQQATETPAELPILTVLGVLSTAIAGKAEIEAEAGYSEPLNIYASPILESGNRKTAVLTAATRPLTTYENRLRERLKPEIDRLESERKSKSAIIDKLRRKLNDGSEEEIRRIAALEAELPSAPNYPRLFSSDCTPESLEVMLADNDGRAAVISDEGGILDVMAGRYSQKAPNLDVFLRGHSPAPLRVDRMGRHTSVDSPHLTILISPQPSVIAGLRDKEFLRGRGLLARFLFALPKSLVGQRALKAMPIPPQTVECYERIVRQLLDWKPEQRITLRLSTSAYSEWKDFQRAIETQMAEKGRLCQLRDWGSKLPGAALRIAGLLHIAQWADLLSVMSGEIERAEIDVAIEICATLVSHAAAVFNLMYEDPHILTARRLLKWLLSRQTQEISKRDCYRQHHPHVFKRMEEMNQSLKVLEEHHLVRLGKRSTKGRPEELIYVNPALVKLEL